MRRFAILGALALMALVVVGTVSAASGPKATGDVWWDGGRNNTTYVLHAIFSAQPTVNGTDFKAAAEAVPAKGHVSVVAYDYNDWYSGTQTVMFSFTGTVDCYYQFGALLKNARFSGLESDGTTPFEIAVKDLGEPGLGNDVIATTQQATDTDNGYCGSLKAAKVSPPHVIDIAGNIQVHGQLPEPTP